MGFAALFVFNVLRYSGGNGLVCRLVGRFLKLSGIIIVCTEVVTVETEVDRLSSLNEVKFTGLSN